MNIASIIPRSVLALLLAGALCGFIQDEWKIFSPDEKFSIEIPEGVTMQTMPTPPGFDGKDGAWAMKTADGGCMVCYIEDPEWIGSRSPHEIFPEVAPLIKSRLGFDMDITSEKSILMGTIPGREFKGTGVNKKQKKKPVSFDITARVFVTADRVYFIMGVVRPDVTESLVDRSVGSFKILKP